MLHLLERDEAGEVRVRHVDGGWEVERHNDRPAGRRHFIESAVRVPPTEEGVLHAELIADEVRTKDVPPIACGKKMGQVCSRVERLERQVALFGASNWPYHSASQKVCRSSAMLPMSELGYD